MFKRLFLFSSDGEQVPQSGTYRNGSAARSEGHYSSAATHASPLDKSEAEPESGPEAPERKFSKSLKSMAKKATAPADIGNFEQIYQNAAVKPPQIEYGILKVSEMANSAHLGGMSPEAKRASLLMALEAAGAEIEDLLQDAVVRQRALHDFEEAQQARIKHFEASKLEENAKIQAELDRLTKHYLSLMQSNLDEIAREQNNFRVWQKLKQQESERITEAAAVCVPHGGSTTGNNNLAAVLERATAASRR
ncbi:MAG: hypothetical protein ABSG25_03880 [Bryobacteraceae bacterium]